ncbi:hypothetical protein GIB67_009544 [Kingdonia uniflora]|uniref:RNase H type-1 domain-containing protein n=1 Tax=Kingdonia uniflora TaxID=39325 RepID=A0A7J7NWC1_9MAGN|nr:hypothetical protein GIB67_009544 [Kingdonia uniflora]
MELGHGNGTTKFLLLSPDSNIDEGDDDLLNIDKKSVLSSSSLSSSSDSSFDEDFFLDDDNEPRKSSVGDFGPLKPDELALLGGTKGLASMSPPIAEVSDMGSPGNIGTPFSVSSSDSAYSKSPQQCPPIQLMERSEAPADNYRIPSTVFARSKSTTPVEWSVASNESLFSIHMGNNSFSRDQIFLMGRSGELGRTDDLFKYPNPKAEENFQNASPSPVAEAAAETMKEVLREAAEDRNKNDKPMSSSISHNSDGSGTSVVSFAFPILTGDGGKSVTPKVEPEPQPQQLPQLQTPATPPSAPDTKWFTCMSCYDSLRAANAEEAEAVAVLRGMEAALSSGLHRVLLLTDCLRLVRAFRECSEDLSWRALTLAPDI